MLDGPRHYRFGLNRLRVSSNQTSTQSDVRESPTWTVPAERAAGTGTGPPLGVDPLSCGPLPPFARSGRWPHTSRISGLCALPHSHHIRVLLSFGLWNHSEAPDPDAARSAFQAVRDKPEGTNPHSMVGEGTRGYPRRITGCHPTSGQRSSCGGGLREHPQGTRSLALTYINARLAATGQQVNSNQSPAKLRLVLSVAFQ